MNEINKLYRLYETGEVDLMWQLSKSLGINGIELWTNIYHKYKSDNGDLIIEDGNVYIFRYSTDYSFYICEPRIKSDYHYINYWNSELKKVIKELIKYLNG